MECKNIWDKVFKNGPSKTCLKQTIPFKFFKGCPPQVLLGPFLNTLSHTGLNKVGVTQFQKQYSRGIFKTDCSEMPENPQENSLDRVRID